MKRTCYTVVRSPIGDLTLRWSNDAVVGLHFDNAPILAHRGDWSEDDGCLAPARRQLEEYIHGERTTFDLPLAFEGTPFQQRVWTALTTIPYGTTTSYGELAKRVGEASWPGARAVGAANGKNPIAIIVPCHRVIGADGTLTGFGGGLPRKRWLLSHEGSLAQTELVAC
jgi:methylated-DNA-[protein]-cysteine S-methyltransferase